MPQYGATLQVRVSLADAGWVAGLAGELETTEAVVVRTLLHIAQRERSIESKLEIELERQAQEAAELGEQRDQIEATW